MSRAQLEQDLWVLKHTEDMTSGYFIDIGAFHPSELSNTCLLDERGWRGVCVEPRPHGDWTTRQNTTLLEHVITSDGRDVTFIDGDELGGIEEHVSHHASKVAHKPRISLPSITPTDMLKRAGAPATIDYLSLDTEGSELEILENFPFDSYTVKLITVEHNYEEPKRTQIKTFLEGKGYIREMPCRWDDFYVLRT